MTGKSLTLAIVTRVLRERSLMRRVDMPATTSKARPAGTSSLRRNTRILCNLSRGFFGRGAFYPQGCFPFHSKQIQFTFLTILEGQIGIHKQGISQLCSPETRNQLASDVLLQPTSADVLIAFSRQGSGK